jgi:hypothetical protein
LGCVFEGTGDPVGQAKESRDRRDVPDVLVGEAVGMRGREVVFADPVGAQADLHGKFEHGTLVRGDVRLAPVHRHLVRHQRLLFVDAQQRAVPDHGSLLAMPQA